MFTEMGPKDDPMAIPSCCEQTFELKENCTPLVDNFNNFLKSLIDNIIISKPDKGNGCVILNILIVKIKSFI